MDTGSGPASRHQDQDGVHQSAVVPSQSSITVADDPGIEISAKETSPFVEPSYNRQGVEASRQRLFAVFETKNKETLNETVRQQDSGGGASPSGPSFSGSTSKRSLRSRAAKPRQTTLIDLTLHGEGGDGHSNLEAPSSLLTEFKSRSKKRDEGRPNLARSSLPPLKLNVTGTGLADGQAAHSFFHPKPNDDHTNRGASSCNVKFKSFGSRPLGVRQKPTLSAPWPSRKSVHVLPSEQVDRKWIDDRTLPFPYEDKGKGKEKGNGTVGQASSFESTGLAEKIRQTGYYPAARDPTGLRRGHPSNDTSSSLKSRSQPVPDHAALSFPLDRTKSSRITKTNSSWTDRWQPHSAEEVLGNRVSARYLRDWLFELKIASDTSPDAGPSDEPNTRSSNGVIRLSNASVKKRKIHTGVDKIIKKGSKKSNAPLTSTFFVDDDEDDELYDFFANARPRTSQHVSPDVGDFGSASNGDTELRHGVQDSLELDFRLSERLTNCIVLCGPSGSGKTATIFACADELNFEVFELFPGAGKRGARELKEAVGALGQNHMVSGGGRGGGATRGEFGRGGVFKNPIGKRAADGTNASEAQRSQRGKMVVPDSQDSEDGLSPRQDGGDFAVGSSRAASATRQSLILIEEADLVFEDDRAFWEGVKKLIAQSRRPVILTCNDLSYIPQDDLAIQEILHFCHPDRHVALPYLRLLAEAEGRPATLETIGRTIAYAQVGRAEKLGDTAGEQVDLRQAIHQLHFASSFIEAEATLSGDEGVAGPASPDSNGNIENASGDVACLRHLYRGLSSLSFAHAELMRPFVRQSAGDEPSFPASARSSAQSETDSKKSSNSLDLRNDNSSNVAINATTTAGDELMIPGCAGLTPLRPSCTAKACPVVFPLEGREDQIFQTMETYSLAVIRRARGFATSQSHSNKSSGSRDTAADVVAQYSSHSHIKDLYTQTSHLEAMLSPLFVFELPLPPHPPSSRPFCFEACKLATAPSKFWLDYAPYVRWMVKIEDFEDAVRRYAQQEANCLQDDNAGSAGETRSLRHSTRLSRIANQERIMPLTQEGLDAARASGSGLALSQFSGPSASSSVKTQK